MLRKYYAVLINSENSGIVNTRNSKEREFIYDYTEEIPKLIATYDSDGTVVDYYYATDRISTLITNSKLKLNIEFQNTDINVLLSKRNFAMKGVLLYACKIS